MLSCNIRNYLVKAQSERYIIIIIMKSFVTSQFGYCLLNWMLYNRRINYKINCILQRTLRITYQDHVTFQELLNKDNSV